MAMSIPSRTINDCSLQQKGPYMIAMSKFVLETRDYDFWTNLVKIKFRLSQSYLVLFVRDCNYISDWKWTLQSYLVPIMISIAILFDSFFDQDCNHIRFAL